MEQLNKLKTYIGFAIKSRHIKYGVDDIVKMRYAELVLVSKSLTESSLNKVQRYAEKTKSKIILLDESDFNCMFDNSKNIKAIAITDKSLADAINQKMTDIG